MAGRRADVGVIIAAGGAGRRFGGATPKQFLLLGGITILQRSIEAFHRLPQVAEIIVVAPGSQLRRVQALLRRFPPGPACRAVPGGRERQDSVRNGLLGFSRPPRIVLVHDAVRPLVSRRVIRAVTSAARRYGAAVVGVRVTDTIKREFPPGFAGGTLDRRELWAAQTPQGFRYRLLLTAHERAMAERFSGTDESSLVERLGRPVRIVRGETGNRKITTHEDLQIARLFVK